MRLARIGSTGPTWTPDDMTGAGAAASPGRWNRTGERVIYAAPSLAMAVLETAAHIDDSGLPLNKYVIEIDVPDDVWAARLVIPASALPVGWDAIPHGVVSIGVGSNWYASGAQAIVELPSVIAPEETIVVINAQHGDSRRMRARATRRLQYNLLFRGR
ncbi:RES family NAD+ phosphorylase [Stenotrophomonas sp. ISL-67]|uniref:RES family NAD+ phosphorylase n=1 Tax=Stenotrophomonas sp. ISL-67 TaxID=2819171 RepID=UPI001BE5529B|nr:RES family NAD+ phosphorylase [Stenotrophomonas sp. ISL-67]MBT2766906.1 RES family NAD+ phosphorylase [Stenotrophomonas sp. ISL-67]